MKGSAASRLGAAKACGASAAATLAGAKMAHAKSCCGSKKSAQKSALAAATAAL